MTLRLRLLPIVVAAAILPIAHAHDTDSQSGPLGKVSFAVDALETNFTAFMDQIIRMKPATAKGVYRAESYLFVVYVSDEAHFVAYAWPAHTHPFLYGVDRRQAMESIEGFIGFVRFLDERTEARRIHLVTSSAGAPPA